MTKLIALLRGINVGGHKKIAMAELRLLCESLGFTEVQTYIQSGNVIFDAPGGPAGLAAAVEAKLEKAIEARFGFAVDVLVRSASEWPALVRENPFSEVSAQEPNFVMMALAKRPPSPDAVGTLRERARDGERIEAAGEALWFYYPSGAGRSKLTPTLIDRAVGSPVTARNYRTVLKLGELAGVSD